MPLRLKNLGVTVAVAMSGLTADPYGAAGIRACVARSGGCPRCDGTVLGAPGHLAVHDVPILCFNVGGHLGFLTHEPGQLRREGLWQRLMTTSPWSAA